MPKTESEMMASTEKVARKIGVLKMDSEEARSFLKSSRLGDLSVSEVRIPVEGHTRLITHNWSDREIRSLLECKEGRKISDRAFRKYKKRRISDLRVPMELRHIWDFVRSYHTDKQIKDCLLIFLRSLSYREKD